MEIANNKMHNLKVALIQTNLLWENIPANLQMLEEKIMSIREQVKLIVLPEMFSTGFSMHAERLAEEMNGLTIDWLRKMAGTKKCVITGSLMLSEENENKKKYYNRLIWMLPDGQYKTYDKKHLFGLSQEHKVYTKGDYKLIDLVDGWNICPMICYDLRFPVWSRNAINTEREATYDVLVYVANWPERRSAAWRTLLQARAIENQCYVIGVNRVGEDGDGIYHSGDSSVIGPLGEILYTKVHEEDIAIIDLNYEELVKARRQFPFLKDADAFELL